MKRLFLVILFSLILTFPAFAIEIDDDANDAVDIANGGTNATSASAARTNLGLVIGTDVLAPDGDGSSLTSITLGDNPDLSGTERVNIPGGTTGTRPSGTYGDVRYNSTLGVLEWYDTDWNSILDDSDLGVSVQAYDADTAKTDVSETVTAAWTFSSSTGLTLGVEDSANSSLSIHGSEGDVCGSVLFYNGGSNDTTVDYWKLTAAGTDFTFGPDTALTAFTFDNAGDLGLTTLTASGAVSAGSLTVESNTIDFGDVTEDYVLTFNASTNTWSGEAASGGTTLPADPGADRYLMWDDSETGSELTWVELSGGVADDSLLEVKLDSTNAPTDNYILSYDDTSGGFTWVAPGSGTGDLLADGTVPLTANWDVGAYTITGTQFISDIAIGTAPFVVTSTTVVTNLNADTVDGESASAFEDADAAIVKSDEAETLSAAWDLGTPSAIVLTNASGTASININGTVGATTPAAGAFTTVTANSYATGSSTTPQLELEDATDDADGEIKIIASSVSTDTYDSVLLMQVDEAGVATTYIEVDGADNTVNLLKPVVTSDNVTISDGVLFLKEQAEADADIAGYGQIWVNTAEPNELWWTNDAGTDVQLGVGGSETNSLETVCTGIATTEIPIGTSADTATYAALSGDVTMANTGAVTIANNAVENVMMADNAIDSAEIASGAIDLAHMSANSVDSDQYVDGSIDNVHLADGAVDTAEIADDAITAALIDDNAVTYAATAGSYKALTPVTGDPDSVSPATADYYGGTIIFNAAGTFSLPAVAEGMSFTVINDDDQDALCDPDDSGTEDTITAIIGGGALDTSFAQGESLDFNSTSGICTFQYAAADTWLCICTGDVSEETP